LTITRPYKFNERYILADWTSADADYQLELLNVYAANLQPKHSNSVLAYALQEALLLFPQSPRAERWRWELAKTLAQLDDPRAGDYYLQAVEQAVESGSIRVQDLVGWFSLFEKDLVLNHYPFPAQPGELSRQLIEITGAGSAYLWLIELPGSVRAYPLVNLFDFSTPVETGFEIQDITGNGIPEVIIYERTTKPDEHRITSPRVFNLAKIPPSELPFAVQPPFSYGVQGEVSLVTVPGSPGNQDIQITTRFFPACPVLITTIYRWDGERFVSYPPQYEITPQEGIEAYCEISVDYAANFWGPQTALALAEQLINFWPPDRNTEGKLYPADAADAWRMRIAVYHALSGQQIEAQKVLTEIIKNPATPDSSWIILAQSFLEKYQKPEDIYQVCRQAPFCNPRDALRRLTILSRAPDTDQALDFLRRNGVETRSSGAFDFDLDGINERWFTVQHASGSKLEFWILTNSPQGVHPLFYDIVESNAPTPYYYEPAGDTPVIQLETGRGMILARVPEIQIPYLISTVTEFARPTIIRDHLEEAIQGLFSGEKPEKILEQLIEIKESPRLIADCRAFQICDRFWYTLALVYQITGYDRKAVDTYIHLWWEESKSMYNVMGRLKLIFLPPPPTFTATPTRTRTVTPTPTITNTPDPFATPSLTPTQTLTVTPDPNITSTPTRTPTLTTSPYP
jgi:hypothetical protein